MVHSNLVCYYYILSACYDGFNQPSSVAVLLVYSMNRPLKVKKNGVFLFVISHLVPEIFKIFVLCNLGTDDVIRCDNMEVKTQNREYLCK